MKIVFKQTGGFAGLQKVVELDCDEIPDQEAAHIKTLISRASFFDIEQPSVNAMPDQENYTLSVESNDGSRTMHLSKSNVPDTLQPLVGFLVKRAKFQKRMRKN